jgi:YVTN family beta-propeller protein
VGTVVNASGSGFAPSSTIAFTFGGIAISASCSTNLTGSFPAISSLPCSFSVPPAPGGPESVTASDGTNLSDATFVVNESVVVSPGRGPVGQPVSASGFGAPPDANVSLSFDGGLVNSSCASDSNGTFPGTTGTGCSFIIPSAPAGPEPTAVSGIPGLVGSVPVGDSPIAIADDSGTGEIFAANENSNTVSVIAQKNDTVVATIAVGCDPDGLVYDSAQSEVFVANACSRNVSVISDTTDQVLTSVALPRGQPAGLALDNRTDTVYVAMFGKSNVSVISASTNAVVENISVGRSPYVIAYDYGKNEMFVANSATFNVSVINASSYNITATVPLPLDSYPRGIAYDPRTSEVFVSLWFPNVTVISDVTNSVVANVSLGGSQNSPYGLDYDPATSQILVSEPLGYNVSGISDVSDTVAFTLNLPIFTDPYAVVYDPETDLAYAVDSVTPGSVIILQLPSASASAWFDVVPSLVLPSSAVRVDVGQNLTIEGNGFGGSTPIAALRLGTFALVCTSATIGTCVGGLLTSAPNGSYVTNVSVPSVGSSGTFSVFANDSEGNSAITNVTVYVDPAVGTPSALPASIDLGQSTHFTVNASFGSGNYTYAWRDLPRGCGGGGPSLDCTPTVVGTFEVSVNVTDSDGFSRVSPALAFTVEPDPVISIPSSNLSSGLVDAGQAVTFSVVASNGSGTYASYGWSGLPAGCTGTAASVSCRGGDLSYGQYHIGAQVTDSNGFTSAPGAELLFVVDHDPTLAPPIASRNSLDAGQNVTISASVSDAGSGGDTYAWSGLPSGCTASPLSSITCHPDSNGTDSIQVQVTDSNRFVATSGVLALTVFSAPSVAVTANRTVLDVGESVTLTAQALFGSGGYSFAWSGLPAGCGTQTASTECIVRDYGNDSVRVTVSDSNGYSNESAPIVLSVARSLSASFNETPSSAEIGQSVEFVCETSGGIGPYTYAWRFGDGATAAGAAVEHIYESAGNFTVILTVNDSTGTSTQKSIVVTVTPRASLPATSTAPVALWTIALASAVAVLGAVALAVILMRRRSKRGQEQWEEGSHETHPSPLGSEMDDEHEEE